MLTLEQHHEPQPTYRNGRDRSPPQVWVDEMERVEQKQQSRTRAKNLRERVIRFACDNADIFGFAFSGLVIIATVLVTA
jgi:hypothetical protein